MKQLNGILDYFRILKERNILGTSYLFIGENLSLVFDIARLINCQNSSKFNYCGVCWDCRQLENKNHPDLLIIEPEGFNIKIESIREGIRFLALRSFKLIRKVIVIKDAGSLSQEAANAFLKTLEEPPKNSFIAVCTSKLEGMLPTIVSRCRKIFLPLDSNAIQVDKSNLELVSKFLSGESLEFKDRKRFLSFLWSFILLLHDNMLAKALGDESQFSIRSESEVYLKTKDIDQLEDIIKNTLEIYSASGNVNINLALNLIRQKMRR